MGLSDHAKILFHPKRFEIATLLYIRGRMTFSQLRRATGLTWGDLDSNIRYMESKGLVSTRKILTVGGPRTVVELTEEGAEAYQELTVYLSRRLGELGGKTG